MKILKHFKTAKKLSLRHVSNHNFEQNPILPVFWREKNSASVERYIVDSTGENMLDGPDKNPALARKIRETFVKSGMVLIRGNRAIADDLKIMKKWVQVVFPESGTKYGGGANHRKGLKVEAVYETGVPPEARFHYHHEMEYLRTSYKSISFCCYKAIEDKNDPLRGALGLSDVYACTDTVLGTEFGRKLKEKGICYIRCLTNREKHGNGTKGIYNHWQTSFMTDDRTEAERRAKEMGLLVEWGPDGYMKTKFYASGFEYFPAGDRNLLYTSPGNHGLCFDKWPIMSSMPYMTSYEKCTDRERPLALTYGDDSELTREDIQTFVDVFDEHGMPIAWEKGDIACLCNYRFAHGKPAYTLKTGEARELGVILGEMYDRQGARNDKW